MATKLEVDFDYTNAEMIRVAKQSIAHALLNGVGYSLGGRQYSHSQLPALLETLKHFESALSDETGIAINVARIGRA